MGKGEKNNGLHCMAKFSRNQQDQKLEFEVNLSCTYLHWDLQEACALQKPWKMQFQDPHEKPCYKSCIQIPESTINVDVIGRKSTAQKNI
jgi:hypothetical protein